MARTEVKSKQIKDQEVKRDDLNTTESGQAVVAKLIEGTGISFSSTGPDAGTGDVTISANITSLPVSDNNVYQQWRNSADDDNIDVLKVDSSDNTELKSASGSDINFKGGSTTHFIIKSFGAILHTANNSYVGLNTSDGSDTKRLTVCAGDADATTRSALIRYHGNEHASLPGILDLHAGNVTGAEIRFSTANIKRWSVEDDGNFVANSNGIIRTTTNSGTLQIASGSTSGQASGATLWLYGETSANPGTAQFYGNGSLDINIDPIHLGSGSTSWKASGSHLLSRGGEIRSDTTDGDDDNFLRLSGGGSHSVSRGASIVAGGNESVFPGHIILNTGAVSGAEIQFSPSSTKRWAMNSSGDFVPTGNGTIDIGSSSFRVGTLYVDTLDALNGAGGGVNDNNTYIQWRNNADDADLDILKVDSNDDTILSAFNEHIRFWPVNNSGSREMTINWTGAYTRLYSDSLQLDASTVLDINSSTNSGRLFFNNVSGDVELTNSNGNFRVSCVTEFGNNGGNWTWGVASNNHLKFNTVNGTISATTSDGADNQYLALTGGGAFSSGRGASIQINGNEAGNAGDLVLSSGSTGTVRLSSFNPIEFNQDLIPTGTIFTLRQNVTNGVLELQGGSDTSNGAYIELYGETHAQTGRINIIAGDVAGSELLLQTPASEPISFAVGAAVRFKATGSTFEPQVDSAYTLGSPTKAFSAIYVDTIVGPNILQSLNALTNSTQTFATGTSGSDFNISSGGSTHTFSIPDASSSARGLITSAAQTIGGTKTFANDVIVDGNLTVNGTQTIVNTETVEVADNIMLLNNDVTGTPTEDSGIEVERGTETNAQLVWDESEDKFAAGLVGSIEPIVLEGDVYTHEEVTGTSKSATKNLEYICNNASLVTVTLPSTISQGDKIRIIGKGTGGWRLAQNSGQTINFGTSSTTTGASGYIDSTNQYDVVEIICITDDTDFVVISSVGNLDVN